MNVTKLVSGKVILNQFVHRLAQDGAVFRIHYWGAMPKLYNNSLHKHSFFEICYVIKGEGTYMDDSHIYPIKSDTLFFSRPDVLHQIKSETGLLILYVGFELIESESSEHWIHTIKEAKRHSKVITSAQENVPLALLWQSLFLQAAAPRHAFFEKTVIHSAYALICALLDAFSPQPASNLPDVSKESSSAFLNQVQLYMKDNLASPLRIADVANHFHISSRHLSRIFMSELGVNYSDFLKNERIQRAANLLKTTDLSIKDITEKTGFSTVHYFTRVFTAELGSPPHLFRRLYANKKTESYQAKQ